MERWRSLWRVLSSFVTAFISTLSIRDSRLCGRGSSAHRSGCAGFAGAGGILFRESARSVAGALRLDSCLQRARLWAWR